MLNALSQCLGALTRGASTVLHLLSKGNPLPLQGIYSHYLLLLLLPQDPSMPICRISVILLGARWSLGRFLVVFPHPGPCLLPGALLPFLVGALGRGCQGVTGWVRVCHLCHLPAHRNSSFCWQVQPFLVHPLNLSRLRYIPIQKSLPFFLLPCFHRQLNVKFLLLSFLLLFSLVAQK